MSKINMQVTANGNLEGGNRLPPGTDGRNRDLLLPDLEMNCYRSFYIAILGVRTFIAILLAVLILSGIFVHDIFDHEASFPPFKRDNDKESKIISNQEPSQNTLFPPDNFHDKMQSKIIPAKKIIAVTIVASFLYLSLKTIIGWLAMITMKKKYLHLALLLECISLFLCGYILDPLKSICALIIVSIQAICILSLVKLIKISNASPVTR